MPVPAVLRVPNDGPLRASLRGTTAADWIQMQAAKEKPGECVVAQEAAPDLILRQAQDEASCWRPLLEWASTSPVMPGLDPGIHEHLRNALT